MRDRTKKDTPRRAFSTVLWFWILGYVLLIVFTATLSVNSANADADIPGVSSGDPLTLETAPATIPQEDTAPSKPTTDEIPVQQVPPKKTEEVVENLDAQTPEEPEAPEYTVYEEIPIDEELQCAMQAACEKYNVPFELALAIAEAESTFNPDADNGLCFGLMQINRVNFEWLRELGIEPTTYEGNIEAGVYILSEHLANFEDWNRALMAYNCGAAGAKRQWDEGYTSSPYSRSIVARAYWWSAIINTEKTI